MSASLDGSADNPDPSHFGRRNRGWLSTASDSSQHPEETVRRVQRTAQLAAYAVLLVTAASCGSETGQADDEPAAADLDGSWVLTAGSDHGAALALDDSHPVTLDLDGNEPSGVSACNNYSGTMDTDADTITFSNLGGTEMACMPPSVMELEQAYLAALQTVTTAKRDGDALTLTGPDLTLTFETVPAVPQAELEGTHWLLESLIEGELASSISGEAATLVLDGNGGLTFSTGCRSFLGGYERSGDQVRVLGGLASTERGCPPGLDQQDRHVLAALQDGFGIAIEGDVLTVTGPAGNGLVYRRR